MKVIMKNVPREYDFKNKCVVFKLPEGDFKMPYGEITPYRVKNPLKELERNIVASFYKMKNGEIALSRKRAILKQYRFYNVGDTVRGYVDDIINGGIFLDFGQGLRGFCPHSETSVCHFNDISKIYPIGTEIVMRIIEIDSEYPYHITLSIKKAASKKEIKVNKTDTNMIIVIIGNPLADGSGSFCSISPRQVGIMDKAPGFNPDTSLEGKRAYAIVKSIITFTNDSGKKMRKYRLDFVGYVPEE